MAAVAATDKMMFRRVPVWLSARAIAISIAAALFIMLCALPVIYMFLVSFISADGSFTFNNYGRLLAESRQRELLMTSTLLGAGAAVLATVIGAPLGLLLARANLPAKRILRFAFVVPLVIPPYILALAWIYVGGSAGVAAQLFGRDLLSGWTYSLAGAIVVLGISFYPLSMLATEAAARRVDGRLEEAALLVAPQRRVLWRITLPLIGPSIAAASTISALPQRLPCQCLLWRSLQVSQPSSSLVSVCLRRDAVSTRVCRCRLALGVRQHLLV